MSFFPHRRRGANAVEFALLLPFLTLIMGGLVDFGWFFYREGLVTNALRDAVRAGAGVHQTVSEVNTGGCAACIATTQAVAVASLADVGITVASLSPAPQMIALSGTCGIQLAPTNITHTPLMGLVPMPTSYRIQLTYMALYCQ